MNPTKWIEDCEREPIHAPGCIQPWGALLVAHQADQTVRYASANLGAFIGQSAADAIGQTLATLLAGCADHPDLTITQHRLGELLYADIEWAEPGGPGATAAEAWVSARRVIEVLRGARSSAELFTVAVDEIRRATGFDRAMFYRFDPVGHGEVVAETCVDGLEPLLGIHYPASDVPRQARRLYLRQLVRVIGDVDAVPVPLLGGGDLVGRVDLSPSALRAVAPIHLTYLRNMGVAATAAVSITMDQALSGLLVCHHRQPRVLPPGARAVCDLIGQVTSLMLATLRASEARAALTARRARILGISARLGGCGDGAAGLAAGLADAAADLLSLCGASGAICRLGGRIIWAGDAPAGAAATGLLNALLAAAAASGGSGAEPFASQALHATLGQDALCELPPHLAGALLLPIPPTPGDAIVWLRPEQAHTVTWGGDPRRPTEFDAASGVPQPRRSFAVWREEVRGQSTPWTAEDLDGARDLRRELERLLAGYAEQMRAARDQADRETRLKSDFLATMSHEIRSPISGLMGVLDLLRATPLDPEQSRMAGMIHHSASMLLAVLNDVLDFSKIEAGAMSVALEPAALRSLLVELVQPYSVVARQKGVTVELAIDPELPEWLLTDKLRVRQILGNLLSNALKFTATGRIDVQASLVRPAGQPGAQSAAEARLRLAVRDSGIGMSQGVLARLFQPFMQGEGSAARTFGGTGLGLAISKKLAGLLNGDLTVSSRAGEGSEFALLLPLLACGPAGEDVAASAVAPVHRGGHVLVVDDDATIRWLTQRQLEMLGFTADVAADGEAGLQHLLAGAYDLVLTDCHMPRMDGAALTSAVRASDNPALRRLPIIGLTADVTEAQRDLCLAAGMSELAIKPLTAALLSHLLARHLAGRTDAPPAAPATQALRAVAFDDQIYQAVFEPGSPDGAAWLDDYLQTARADVEELHGLLGGSPEAVAIVAHRLAGSSFSAGAMLLGEAAKTLERSARSGDPAALPTLLAAVRSRLAQATDAIRHFLAPAKSELVN